MPYFVRIVRGRCCVLAAHVRNGNAFGDVILGAATARLHLLIVGARMEIARQLASVAPAYLSPAPKVFDLSDVPFPAFVRSWHECSELFHGLRADKFSRYGHYLRMVMVAVLAVRVAATLVKRIVHARRRLVQIATVDGKAIR